MTVKLSDVHSLPICPSASTLKSLTPTQQATILEHISSTLFYALSLSDDKLSNLSCYDFVASYARGEASISLNDLVFSDLSTPEERGRTTQEKLIQRRVLSLASRLAGLPKAGGLTLQAILDMSIVFGPKHSGKVKELIQKAVVSNSALLQEIQFSAAPSFVAVLLSADSGLHALRKTAFCLKCLLQCAPPSVLDEFVRNNEFALALAKCYENRLNAIAAVYGGININDTHESDTTTLWVGCKVSLIDSFHVLFEHILTGVRADPQMHAERAFDLVFTLLNLPSMSAHPSSSASRTRTQTPFLNRSLIADYQDAYGLSATLASVLSNNDDPRLDVLEATLKSFEYDSGGTGGDRSGALKILLRSSGVPPGIGYRGGSKGKERAAPQFAPDRQPEPEDADLDIAVSSVLDILPDHEPFYIRALLNLPQYDRNAERVISALLEGDAPPPSELKPQSQIIPSSTPVPQAPLPERRNVFNDQPMEISSVNIGKRREDTDAALQDRAFVEQMKLDILRRAAELSDSDNEDGDADVDLDLDLGPGGGGMKVVVAGGEDMDESDDDDDDDDEDEGEGEDGQDGGAPQAQPQPETPETMCELVYIADPSVFNRDAYTRRSKARADLKARTGWSDEQLEGWRIMLEKNPRKDKILLKHEFTGNQKGLAVAGSSSSRAGRGRGRGGGPGRGRGGGGGGGSGRGGGTQGEGGGGGDGGDARQRAWKDKNKARQANHNRKRGHDRKMLRGGGSYGGLGRATLVVQ